MTLNISSSVIGATLGRGTLHLPAFCFRFSLIVLLSTWQQGALSTDTPSHRNGIYRVRDALTFARFTSPRSSRYGGIEPSVCLESSGADAFFSLWAFSLWRDAKSFSGRANRCARQAAWRGLCARLFHVCLLLETLLIKKLGAQTLDLLRVLRPLVHHTGILLATEPRRCPQ